MPVVIKELVITVKANEERQQPITRMRKEERSQAQKKGQDALVREAVNQTLQILKDKKER